MRRSHKRARHAAVLMAPVIASRRAYAWGVAMALVIAPRVLLAGGEVAPCPSRGSVVCCRGEDGRGRTIISI